MSNNIDKIIYINLNRRQDRQELIEKELNDMQLNYERFDAIDCPEQGIYGCGLSHLEVLKLARDRKYKNVLIFEDDFTFLVSKNEFEENLKLFFESNLNYDVCMLSYNIHESCDVGDEIVNKMTFCQTASGYIVNGHYFDKLIKLYEWAMPLLRQTRQHWIYANDIVWRNLQKQDNWYHFKTRIGKQRSGISDGGDCPCYQERDT